MPGGDLGKAMQMTAPETKYRVQSLERGLAILRELRLADVPVRNQDLVSRTGLPKATVSRLLNTLGILGYVRRIDQGTYVLANGSARSGRAMLGALRLDQHDAGLPPERGTVYLEAIVGNAWVPVYRWSQKMVGPLPSGARVPLAHERARDCGDGDAWSPSSSTWWAWTRLHIEGVGDFVLTLQDAREPPPSTQEQDSAHAMLRRAGKALSGAKEQ